MRRAGLLWLLALLATQPAAADRLHLESGGVVDTARWWVEGDTLYYEGAGGTVGIPRSLVVRIVAGRSAEPQPSSTFNQAPRRAAPLVPRLDRDELEEQLRLAHAALEARNYDGASAHYLALVRAAPRLYVARVGYAISEMALGRDGLALSVVLDGLSLDPQAAQLHELLGELRYREERVEDAVRSWRRAFELQPSDRLRDKILRVERELHASRDYDFAASPHFNVRYDGDVDLELASAVLDYLEEQYWELSDLFRHAPPQPITVQLYPRRAFRDVTQTAEWVGGVYDGKIRVPLGGLSRLTPDARRVLVHELSHAVLHSKTRGQAPRWLHEGLAQIAEGKRVTRAESTSLVERLRARPEAEWSTFEFSYPAALSLTRYLETRRGHDGLVELLELLGEGRGLDEALREIYGRTHAELCRAWSEALVEGAR